MGLCEALNYQLQFCIMASGFVSVGHAGGGNIDYYLREGECVDFKHFRIIFVIVTRPSGRGDCRIIDIFKKPRPEGRATCHFTTNKTIFFNN